MSTMASTGTLRRSRRRFSEEFKTGAVRLVLDEGRTVGSVARDLDLTESALRTSLARHGRSMICGCIVTAETPAETLAVVALAEQPGYLPLCAGDTIPDPEPRRDFYRLG